MPLYPFKFRPRFLEKIWGGRKFQTVLGKTMDSPKPMGESWELFDFPPGIVDNSGQWSSVPIANGPLTGRTLHWAIEQFGADLMGKVPLLPPHGQFPLLLKYLDACQSLSVQVHPDQGYAQAHPGAHLKNEAWYVVQHEPGSMLFKGLNAGADRQALSRAIGQGTVMNLLNAIPVKVGQCHYLPSGTVHALGAGILVAEVQTPSDTTFRLFDYNRLDDATGRPRTLHVEQALECIDFSGRPETPQPRTHLGGMFTTVSRLVTCPYFKLEKVRFSEGVEQAVPYDQPVIWMMLEGQARLKVADLSESVQLSGGDTVLLPAKMKDPMIKTLTDCQWLEITL